MVFNNVKSLSIKFDEEWGPGKYVFEIATKADIARTEHGQQIFCTTVLLNSGDKINIVCESIEICD